MTTPNLPPPSDRRPQQAGGLTSLEPGYPPVLETTLHPHTSTIPQGFRTYSDWVHSPHARERSRILQALRRLQIDHATTADLASRSPQLSVDLTQPDPTGRILSQLEACCRSPSAHFEPDTGRIVLHEHRCKHRLCPRCARFRARDLAARTLAMMHLLDSPRFITLTLASSDAPLRSQLRELSDSFARLRRSKLWKAKVTGGVQFIECTYNWSRDQWHPHLHILADGQYIPQAQLSDAWKTASAGSSIVDIRKVHSARSAANYVAKYVSKTTSVAHLPDERIAEWAMQVRSLRLTQTFGRLHAMKLETPEKPEKTQRVHLANINELTYHAHRGDPIAAELARELIAAAHRRLPNADAHASAELEARNRALVDRVRAWESVIGTPHDHMLDRRSCPRFPRDPDADGTLWLGQDPNALPPY